MYQQILHHELSNILPNLSLADLAFGIKNHFLTVDQAKKYVTESLTENSSAELYALILEDDNHVVSHVILSHYDEYNTLHQQKLWSYIFLTWIDTYKPLDDKRFSYTDYFVGNLNYPEALKTIVSYFPLPKGQAGGFDWLDKQRHLIRQALAEELQINKD
ncbi:DUF2247 family protein [Bartonella sp. HY761]|uniref:DUF2247 family protein n=1 Tax=Bartonella sp. HY761 TaxID=2979330 RepID=UPI00220836DC|nr:DUF2247 family protein [Bartonella sp. HY761]UXN06023.1 DUF2247 family protein [Bartonella sp. HY761]